MREAALLLPMKGVIEANHTDLNTVKEHLTEVAEANNLAHAEFRSNHAQISGSMSDISLCKEALGQLKTQVSANSALIKQVLMVRFAKI